MRILEERNQYIIEYVIVYTQDTFGCPTAVMQVCLTDKINNQIFLELTKDFTAESLIKVGKKLIRRWKKDVRENAIH